MLAYRAYQLFFALSARVSRSVGYAICEILGYVGYCLGASGRRAVRSNLRHVLGREPDASLIREAFVSSMKNYFDTFRSASLSSTEIERWTTFEGLEHLEHALDRGKGVILLGGHVCSPALAAKLVSMRGHSIQVVVEPMRPARLYELLARYRETHGISLVPMDDPSVGRHLIRELRANRIVGLMIDRDITGKGEPVPLFDAPARLPTGPALLSIATGAVMLPAFAFREENGTVHGVIEPPVSVESTGDRQADALELTRRLAKRLEYYVAKVPGQWTLFTPVWDDSLELPSASRHTTT